MPFVMRFMPAGRDAMWASNCPGCGVRIHQGESKERLVYLVAARASSKIWHVWCQQPISQPYFTNKYGE